jgi:L-aminopeptidase/D-esterase-like protein
MPAIIQGIKIGHYTNLEAATGCTVIICDKGATGGVDVRGSAPGTRETDLLRPMNMVEKVHAVLLSGGSAFGLNAAAGVMRYLEENNIGLVTPAGSVPIVPAAVLYDLEIGSSTIRPGQEEGYLACQDATGISSAEGCIGAGTGATVGKLMGINLATKSGLGIARQPIARDISVMAVFAVNALGDVIDSKTGSIVAGTRSPDGKYFAGSTELLKRMANGLPPQGMTNTTIGAVITNARLNKEQANKVAQMAHNGIARTIDPCHTMFDGDTIFALSTGQYECDVNIIGTIAAHAVSQAIIRAVLKATSLHGIPASCNLLS